MLVYYQIGLGRPTARRACFSGAVPSRAALHAGTDLRAHLITAARALSASPLAEVQILVMTEAMLDLMPPYRRDVLVAHWPWIGPYPIVRRRTTTRPSMDAAKSPDIHWITPIDDRVLTHPVSLIPPW